MVPGGPEGVEETEEGGEMVAADDMASPTEYAILLPLSATLLLTSFSSAWQDARRGPLNPPKTI
jgi:hypothetical protein